MPITLPDLPLDNNAFEFRHEKHHRNFVNANLG